MRTEAAWLVALAVLGSAGAAAAQTPGVADQMRHAVNPAALAFWAAGNDPPEGETARQAEARWLAALGAADVLQAEGRRLQQPAYVRPGRWAEFSRMMMQTAASAVPALKARDTEAAFEAGGRLYDSCNGCHKTYMPASR